MKLTKAERDARNEKVLKLTKLGLNGPVICARLGIAEATLRTIKKQIRADHEKQETGALR
jgi:3-methyladenine DNA glycosylase AlkD